MGQEGRRGVDGNKCRLTDVMPSKIQKGFSPSPRQSHVTMHDFIERKYLQDGGRNLGRHRGVYLVLRLARCSLGSSSRMSWTGARSCFRILCDSTMRMASDAYELSLDLDEVEEASA